MQLRLKTSYQLRRSIRRLEQAQASASSAPIVQAKGAPCFGAKQKHCRRAVALQAVRQGWQRLLRVQIRFHRMMQRKHLKLVLLSHRR